MQPPVLSLRALAEALGTFALVFAGCGAVITDSTAGQPLGVIGIALAFGLVVAAGVHATGHLSGAHLNPAITLALLAFRRITPGDAVAYITAQLTGALAAAAALHAAWPTDPAALGATVPTVRPGTALLYEVLMTALLMFVIVAVATDPRATGANAALAIGGTVTLDALIGGPLTGASMNPARSLAPALVSGTWTSQWIYIVGPIAGALLGAAAYALSRRPSAEPV